MNEAINSDGLDVALETPTHCRADAETPLPVPTSTPIEVPTPKARTKSKRDIIRFLGEKPTAINLEHVTSMYIEGKRISFEFYTKATFIDFVDEEAAKSVFEVLCNTWASEVEIKES